MPPFFAALGPAQTRTVAYEAASIKPAKPADPRQRAMEFLPGGRFRAANIPLFQVLATAYGCPWQSIEVLSDCIKGIPNWMFTELYDVEARAESPRPAAPVQTRNARIRLMLQSVLADRLELRIRRERVEVPGYALVVGPSGAQLQRAKAKEQECVESAPFAPVSASPPGCHQIQGGTGRGMHASAANIADVALFLSNWIDRPIVDATGLAGLYAFDTEGWSSSGGDPSRPTLDDVLYRMGLKLIRRKVTFERFTIDHVERPSAN